MNQADILIFLETAKTQSFSGAARRLRIPKQTVSRRIRAMEAALGYELLFRTTRSVRLTEPGQRFRALAEEAAIVFDQMQNLDGQADDHPQGVLRIACEPLFGDSFLAEVLWRFSKRYPDIELETFFSTRQIDLIAERFDLAVRIGPLRDTTFKLKVLGPARVRYCATPEYLDRCGRPSRPADLKDHQCLALHYEGGSTQQWLFRQGSSDSVLTVSSRIRANSFRVLYRAAQAGLGIVAAPAFYCEEDLRRDKLEPVLDEWLPDFGNINLVYPSQGVVTAKVRAFVDFANQWFTLHPIP